jgi:hypothetical protein
MLQFAQHSPRPRNPHDALFDIAKAHRQTCTVTASGPFEGHPISVYRQLHFITNQETHKRLPVGAKTLKIVIFTSAKQPPSMASKEGFIDFPLASVHLPATLARSDTVVSENHSNLPRLNRNLP